MVQDTVEMYGGTLIIGESEALGGALFALRLPGR
jgi:signal transduction histidine kinase